MRHNIPFARAGAGVVSTEEVVKWLKADELLAGLGKLEPKDEFPILLDFLVEYAGGLELSKLDMTETLTEQAAIRYKAYAISVKKIKTRLLELYDFNADNPVG